MILVKTLLLVLLLLATHSHAFLFKLFGLGGRGYSFRGHRGMRHKRPSYSSSSSSSYLALSPVHWRPAESYGPPVQQPYSQYAVSSNVQTSDTAQNALVTDEFNYSSEELNDEAILQSNTYPNYQPQNNNIITQDFTTAYNQDQQSSSLYQQQASQVLDVARPLVEEHHDADVSEDVIPAGQESWHQENLNDISLQENFNVNSDSQSSPNVNYSPSISYDFTPQSQFISNNNLNQLKDQPEGLDSTNNFGNVLISDQTANGLYDTASFLPQSHPSHSITSAITESQSQSDQSYPSSTEDQDHLGSFSSVDPQSYNDQNYVEDYNSNIFSQDPQKFDNTQNIVVYEDEFDTTASDATQTKLAFNNDIDGATTQYIDGAAVLTSQFQDEIVQVPDFKTSNQFQSSNNGGSFGEVLSGGSRVVAVSTNIIDGGTTFISPQDAAEEDISDLDQSLNPSLDQATLISSSQSYDHYNDDNSQQNLVESSQSGQVLSSQQNNWPNSRFSSWSEGSETAFNNSTAQNTDNLFLSNPEGNSDVSSVLTSSWDRDRENIDRENNNIVYISPQQQILVDLANSYNQDFQDWSQRNDVVIGRSASIPQKN